MIVQKFGGTSVGSAERIKEVANLIQDEQQKIVVLSAMNGTTNQLQKVCDYLKQNNLFKAIVLLEEMEHSYQIIINELLDDKKARNNVRLFIVNRFSILKEQIVVHYNRGDIYVFYSTILTEGEQFSTYLLYQYLLGKKASAFLLQATDFMQLNQYGEPNIEVIKERLNTLLLSRKEQIIITQGFVCLDSMGVISNLNRGGSDYTASLIGAVVNAKEIQIWTDINGMHNNDPRFVMNTTVISHLSYEEAADLAYFGASVLHPSTIRPAQEYNIPIRIKDAFNPEQKGTYIQGTLPSEGITAIASKDHITSINIKSARKFLAPDFLSKVFEVFERYNTPIDMLSVSEISVSLTIDNKEYLSAIIKELKHLGQVEINKGLSIICIVGNMEGESRGVANRITDPLKEIPIRMIVYGGSKHNLSLLVKTQVKKDALEALHKKLFLN